MSVLVGEVKMRRAVVALGGNAFVTPGQRLTMDSQMAFAYRAMRQLQPLLNDDIQLLISHGNGLRLVIF